jgi:hypothetical protein
MTGELIPTGVTFGVGRNSINDAFSGTAYMNNIELDSGGNFSAGTGGGVIYSAGTDLYNIFLTTADGNDITRVQPGANITTGGTANLPVINLTSSPSVNNLTFSGTAIGGGIQAGSGSFTSMSAGTLSGGTIFSGGTPLSLIISSFSGTSGSLWSASTGVKSIIQSLDENLAEGYGSIVFGSGNTVNTSGPTTHKLNYILGGLNNSFTIPGGFLPEFGCNIVIAGRGNELRSTFFTSENSVILGGINNLLYTDNGASIAGSGNTVGADSLAVSIGGKNNSTTLTGGIIIGGVGNTLSSFSAIENLTLISCSGVSMLSSSYSGVQDNTVIMQRAFIDDYIDFKPLTTLPAAQKGRMFFSGGTLNRMMCCTGNTSSDWIII